MESNSCAYENVFYCTYQNNECVESSDPVIIEKGRMLEILEHVGAVKKNFIGFIERDGTIPFWRIGKFPLVRIVLLRDL
jgi:hypothetical protein